MDHVAPSQCSAMGSRPVTVGGRPELYRPTAQMSSEPMTANPPTERRKVDRSVGGCLRGGLFLGLTLRGGGPFDVVGLFDRLGLDLQLDGSAHQDASGLRGTFQAMSQSSRTSSLRW